MNSIAIVAFFACLAAANAGVVVTPGSSKIIQGPSSRTTIVGADGSSISSENPGGSIVQETSHGIVAESAQVVPASPVLAYSAPVAYTAHASPALSYSALPVAYSGHYASYSAPLAYSAPVVSTYNAPLAYSAGVVSENHLDTVVAGPSGTISTRKTVDRPALFAQPQVYAAGVHAYYI